MLLFKTSGETFDSVIKNEKHAFASKPKNWNRGEIVLVSKNKIDLRPREKQIQYIMRLEDIKRAPNSEFEKYWPGNSGRWKYLVICSNTSLVDKPFNLEDVLGKYESQKYSTVQSFCKIKPTDEDKILKWLNLK